MCPDVQVEISRYLTLEETINTFSISILPLLRQAHTKVHLVDASNRFLQIISQHLHQNQISSVRLPANLVKSRYDFSSFQGFDQLVGLTLLNPPGLYAITRFLLWVPTVRTVSLLFDDESKFQYFRGHFYSAVINVARLHIRCRGSNYSPFISEEVSCPYMKNTTTKSFIFDSGHHRLRSNGYCLVNPQTCFLQSITKFIASLINVRRVRFITNRLGLQVFLQIDRWQELISQCAHLDRIVIQLLDDGDFQRQAEDIEQVLRQFRPELTFRIQSAWSGRISWQGEDERCSKVLGLKNKSSSRVLQRK